MDKVLYILRAASKGIIFEKNDVDVIIPYLNKLLKSEGTKLYLKLQFLQVVLSDFNYKELSESSFIDDLPKIYSSRITKVHRYVEDNYHRKMKLRELAGLVNMTDQSFSRFFKKNRIFAMFLYFS